MKRIGWMAFLLAAPLAAQYSVSWEHDLPKALARAKAENKPIFMDLWAEWCGPCRFLQQKVFPSPAAQKALANYVPLSILVEKKDGTPLPEGRVLAQKFNLEAYPTLVILDSDGREVRRNVGAFESGDELSIWLKR